MRDGMFRAMARGLLTMIILGSLSGGFAQAATTAGSVVGVSGQVTVGRDAQRYGLKLGDPVYVGDTIEVRTASS